MLVKICGLMKKEDVAAAVESGADYIGFVFAESKRKVTSHEAALLAADIPSSVKKVGVFVNPTLDEIFEAVAAAELDFIQLHGDETPEFCDTMPKPVIKAFSISQQADVEEMNRYNVAHILADAPGADYRGGGGHTFDWSLIKDASQNIILAGGLTPENVSVAIAETAPIGVDVSSGVETDGQKDHQKINAFIKQAKGSC
ncbi:N-(5'-phosphoribosyl)anthranilate isomerase [Jeotgalibacillus malaysiensis]|uniref:N-(5'-phosphoribosyl)anthranilate isomerase n=1 Tax=Jeotgalibacillus malaysiensis TaxID=1508404 RepID=A0A0B5AM28_9BACL|nr:phosphoribosylanthranilate isomerase [Jeotgalibacillus malaysiensis]AJD91196.1 N-(5'-phosphoribosyl)anthranilate isomerase [Jeotgalibacillus malaysiensis]